ncbi:hypothetical protein [Robbsia andropogonis]|uniref:hypothetical protein n=1 Tax=Robbsia andropogonis TaxID=28092 RepID=UPI0012FC2FAA|nr:hypothetical protein [Robbsia andropogonis]
MTAAAVHRHTPDGYSGAQKRDRPVGQGAAPAVEEAAAGVVAVPTAVVPLIPAPTIPSSHGPSARHHAIDETETDGLEADDTGRTPAGQGAGNEAKPVARALPRGLPADILALDLNLDDALDLGDAEPAHDPLRPDRRR